MGLLHALEVFGRGERVGGRGPAWWIWYCLGEVLQEVGCGWVGAGWALVAAVQYLLAGWGEPGVTNFHYRVWLHFWCHVGQTRSSSPFLPAFLEKLRRITN